MPVKMRLSDYVQESFQIFKASPLTSIVCGLLAGVPFLGSIVVVNYLTCVKKARVEGGSIKLEDLLNFDHFVDKFVGHLLVWIGFCFCFIPGLLIFFALPILADKPETPFMDAIKGSFAFSKGNIVPLLILAITMSFVGSVGILACGFGMLVTIPMSWTILFLAYDDHRDAVTAAAVESGVAL